MVHEITCVVYHIKSALCTYERVKGHACDLAYQFGIRQLLYHPFAEDKMLPHSFLLSPYMRAHTHTR